MRIFAALWLVLGLLVAPLAQAQSCMMHAAPKVVAVEEPCPHHAATETHIKPVSPVVMSVAACLDAPAHIQAEVQPVVALAILPTPSVAPVALQKTEHFAMIASLALPPDVLAFYGHRRI